MDRGAWQAPWGLKDLNITKHLSLFKLYHGDFILVNVMSHES